MKRLLLYIVLFVCICFIIPIVFTISFEGRSSNVEVGSKEVNIIESNEEASSISQYNYGIYNKVKLLHKASNEVEEIDLDEYICNVVSAEMPANFELEALKAQAIIARTYTIEKIVNSNNKHSEADICDDSTCCQAWISKEERLNRWEEEQRYDNWDKIESAVYETKGKIILYDGKPINAFFHSNSGGKTEVPLYVWGGDGYPYLQVVETSGEENYSQYSSEIVVTKKEFIERIKENYKDFEINFEDANSINVEEYTESGRVRTIRFGNVNMSGVEVRKIFGLKSANFNISIEGENIRFDVIGYGHGVGLSQTGADSLAKQGYSYEEIIKHFYIGVTIQDM